MISIERLLDGLEVAIEPLIVSDLSGHPAASGDRGNGRAKARGAATITVALSGLGSVSLSGGATLRLSPQNFEVDLPVPKNKSEPGARKQASLLPAKGARKDHGDADPDIVVASGPVHATYQGGVNLFAKLQDPLIEPLAAQDPIRRSFKEAMEEIV